MRKRITFGRPPGPAPVEPLRTAVCEPLDGGETVTFEWFGDDVRFPAGSFPADGAGAGDTIAAEAVLRGADWLEARWRDGTPRYKHLAVAIRAAGLTREEFARRWRAHAGTAGGTPIPDAARGQAYAQNHVLSGPVDAVNEVWFDDPAALRARAAWFDGRPFDRDLFSSSRLICVREFLVTK